MTSIDRDEFILLIIEAVPGQQLVRVRDGDAFEGRVVEYRPRRVGKILFAKEPIVIERESPSEWRSRLPVSSRTKMRRQREPGKSHSAALKKMSTADVSFLHG